VAATVEDLLDRRARREERDEALVSAELRELIAEARSASTLPGGGLAQDAEAHLLHADALVGDLTEPYPNAWAAVAARWDALSDPWASAAATLREAEAALTTGAPARAVDA